MARKPLAAKPGSNGPRLKPDVILNFEVVPSDLVPDSDSGIGLLDFLMARLADRKRTTVTDNLQ
ncbi:MAG: hypothetical protein K2M06_08935, partial [Muribaculaceae bacterium]|nr:hypothetical protein [Muribaculaceae bacterium]